jgi:hypothetical protein
MSHHGNDSFMNQEQFDKSLQDELGATGSYPNGKINKNDEGEIQIGITKSNDTVVIDFGKPVHWIGFTTAQAIGIGETLIKRAKEIIKDREV